MAMNELYLENDINNANSKLKTNAQKSIMSEIPKELSELSYQELKKLVNELKLQKKVIFTGFVEQEKLNEYFSIGDVFVLITLMYDALPRSLLEACSYGLPLVSSTRGGVSDIVILKSMLS